MNENRKLKALESIATLAQESAEHGQMDPSVYADVFELIAALIHGMVKEVAA